MTTFSNISVLNGHSLKVNDSVQISSTKYFTIIDAELRYNPVSQDFDVIFVVNYVNGDDIGTDRVSIHNLRHLLE